MEYSTSITCFVFEYNKWCIWFIRYEFQTFILFRIIWIITIQHMLYTLISQCIFYWSFSKEDLKPHRNRETSEWHWASKFITLGGDKRLRRRRRIAIKKNTMTGSHKILSASRTFIRMNRIIISGISSSKAFGKYIFNNESYFTKLLLV